MTAVNNNPLVATTPQLNRAGLTLQSGLLLRGSRGAVTAAGGGADTRMHTVATEFEAVFVRQLLQTAHVQGSTAGPYGDMAVDALANGVTSAGGLGLASLIERALSGSNGPERAASGAPAPTDPASCSSSPEACRSTGRFTLNQGSRR